MIELPSATELNEIQREWMNLDPHAPKAEQTRVFKLMERYPKTYVSGHNGTGICMHHGGPTSVNVPFSWALSRCRELGGRTDVAWNGKLGLWYSLEQTATQPDQIYVVLSQTEGFWNNTDGWGATEQTATRFTEEETRRFNLPMTTANDAHWSELATATQAAA